MNLPYHGERHEQDNTVGDGIRDSCHDNNQTIIDTGAI